MLHHHLTLASCFLASFVSGHITNDGTSSVASASSALTLLVFLNQSGRRLSDIISCGMTRSHYIEPLLINNNTLLINNNTILINNNTILINNNTILINNNTILINNNTILINNNTLNACDHVSKMCRPFTN